MSIPVSPKIFPRPDTGLWGSASGLLKCLLQIAMHTPDISIMPPVSFSAANQGVSKPGRYFNSQPRAVKKSTVVAKKSSINPQPMRKCMMDA